MPLTGWQVPVAPVGDQRPSSVPHNYGAPPDWRPATTPSGQTWPPEGQWRPEPTPPQPQVGEPHATGNGNGNGAPHVVPPAGNGTQPTEHGPEQGGPR